MPNFTATTDLRACSICERNLPATADNYYTPPGREMETWCRSCGRPRNGRGRKFGVEIEFIGGYDDLIREMRARGLRVSYEGYTHRVMRSWKIVTDGSVDGGYELVSPPLSGQGGISQIKKACYALQAAGCRIDRQCGLHVHHDISDLSAKAIGRLARVWANNQGATNGLLAPSRRQSGWARPLSDDEVRGFEGIRGSHFESRQREVSGLVGYGDRRYRSLNFAAFPRYGTVELRQHQGTTNAEKVIAWIAFGKAMISWAKSSDATETVATTHELVSRLAANHGLAAATARFLKDRADYFSGARQPVAV